MERPVLDGLLRRLRWRLMLTFAAIAATGLAAFVVVLVVIENGHENRQVDSDLKAQASRAAALMYMEDGQPLIDGVTDDLVTHGPGQLMVFSADERGAAHVLFATPGAHPELMTTLARAALQDIDEAGTFDTVLIDGSPMRAAALPWFENDRTVGAVVTTGPPIPPRSTRILAPALFGGLPLLGLLVAAAWVMAGRSLRPAAEAIADRERFLATAAHELRGPLARLRAGAEAVRRTVPLGAEGGAALHRLVAVADGAAHVVANLLLATRIEHAEVPLRREPVRLDRIAADLEHLVPSLVADVGPEVVVDGDPALLRHALMNLVDNALRHGRVGDDVPTVVVEVTYRDEHPFVRVSDDGPGFPPDIDILARFVSRPGGGTGLGLPLVLWIAEQHGAAVELGGGTTQQPGAVVEITFGQPPSVSRTASDAIPAARSVPPPPG